MLEKKLLAFLPASWHVPCHFFFYTDSIMNMILVALGGAIGAVFRYVFYSKLTASFGKSFPYATLGINVSGSLLVGMLTVIISKMPLLSAELRAFIVIGILGSYTTFSSFSLETLTLWQKGHSISALWYILLSVILSLVSVAIGFYSMRWLFGR